MQRGVCFACGTDLVPVFPDLNRRRTDQQWENALTLQMLGSYGEYVDGSVTIFICKECADELVEKNPFLKVAIDQYLDFGPPIYQASRR